MICVLACALAVVVVAAQSHGGGLNADGRHTNRKTGEYNCHRGGDASFAPPAAPTRQSV